MWSSVVRSAGLAPYLTATSQCVASQLRPLIPAVAVKADSVLVPPAVEPQTSYTLSKTLPRSALRVTSGVHGPSQVRFAHSDITVPDFTDYRRREVQDPNKPSVSSDVSRKAFSYMLVGGTAVTCAYAAKNVVQDLVTTMSASADVLAMAKIEVKLSEIPEGKSVTIKWRGKPLFVRHRTDEEINEVRAVDHTTLRDPEPDDIRVQKPEWLVLIGVCTHLGCVPIANAGDYGGYYCPCHGSHYDASGRLRKGPAPYNLEVPEYVFPDEETLIVG
ncbi:PREDICTED: cytochrome b-c1 complex subunit Rieske, mitochondrial-like [Branchiostoma belcheri]|uniref:Cytochrome b-c1 complex subunit Rieske, mitochondrial n=1 Tax=Branchiostoma belcheri TaxID=7741 RepID=A0A6P4ZHD1_BRABE|nr:PREDICTED: cytochrome b-c1 complex subunit Rieske, mitochondrial-like [Branchiostoma belcheri]